MTANEGYYIICQPSFLVTQFDDMQDFADWAKEGSIQDLEEAVKAFEKEELYEHCVVMQAIRFKKIRAIERTNSMKNDYSA